MEDKITVSLKDSTDVGGCNACTIHTDVDNILMIPHPVIEINLRNISIRVCKRCKKELMRQLKGIK